MKVIQLFVPGPMGGAEKVLLSGVKALQDRGFDTEIWVIQEYRVPHCADEFLLEANELGLKTKTLICYTKFDFKLALALKRKFIEANPTIVHAHGFKAALYGQLSTPKSSKFLITHHGVTSHTFKVKIYEKIEKWAMKRCDKVIAVSEMMRIDLERIGVPSHKVTVVENLLSMEVEPRIIPENKEMTLVFVGRLSYEKGMHILIRALKDLPALVPFKLIIVGDGREKERMEKLAIELGLDKKISFVGFQRKVSSFLKDADALVIPSLREGLPMTLIEACCMGLPIVGSKVGGIPLLVENNVNGLLSKPEDVQGLTNNLVIFDENKNKFLEKACSMADTFINRYSPLKWADNTIEVYNNSVSHR